jgi:hypothetical protein
VLRCDHESGGCIPAYNATLIDECDRKQHGSSPLVPVGSRYLLGVLHRKWWAPAMQYPVYDDANNTGARHFDLWVGYVYKHRFFVIESTPPFTLAGMSEYFELPPYFDNALDRVQFGAGLALDDLRGELTISYGVADCVALSVSVPLAAVLRGFCSGGRVGGPVCAHSWYSYLNRTAAYELFGARAPGRPIPPHPSYEPRGSAV